jgi:hypothetical protein
MQEHVLSHPLSVKQTQIIYASSNFKDKIVTGDTMAYFEKIEMPLEVRLCIAKFFEHFGDTVKLVFINAPYLAEPKLIVF